MQIRSWRNKRRIKFTPEQRAEIRRQPKNLRRRKIRVLKSEIRLKKSGCYMRKKLQSQGLWDWDASRKNNLVVMSVAEFNAKQESEAKLHS